MLETKKVDYYDIADVDYNLDQCIQKDEILEMLNNSVPVEVNGIDLVSGDWHFNTDLTYYIYVNNGVILISSITETISTLYNQLF